MYISKTVSDWHYFDNCCISCQPYYQFIVCQPQCKIISLYAPYFTLLLVKLSCHCWYITFYITYYRHWLKSYHCWHLDRYMSRCHWPSPFATFCILVLCDLSPPLVELSPLLASHVFYIFWYHPQSNLHCYWHPHDRFLYIVDVVWCCLLILFSIKLYFDWIVASKNVSLMIRRWNYDIMFVNLILLWYNHIVLSTSVIFNFVILLLHK